ncbi:MAG: hypothetical protein KDD64_07340 [Bdellovibrionales bacterium]|nr:hypothetical protein [Bdellovibrionales bacterium]
MVDQQTERVRVADEQVTETVRVTPEAMRDVLAQLSAPQTLTEQNSSKNAPSNISAPMERQDEIPHQLPQTPKPDFRRVNSQPEFSDAHLTTEQLDVAAIPGMRKGHALVPEAPHLKLAPGPFTQEMAAPVGIKSIPKATPSTPPREIDLEAITWALDETRVRLTREMANAA